MFTNTIKSYESRCVGTLTDPADLTFNILTSTIFDFQTKIYIIYILYISLNVFSNSVKHHKGLFVKLLNVKLLKKIVYKVLFTRPMVG